MTFGVDPFGYLAFAEITDADMPSQLAQAWDADAGRIFLVELTAYKRGTGGTWDSPFGFDPFGTVPAGATVTGEVVFRYSDCGYTSRPTDTPASTNFDGSLEAGLRLTRSTPAVPEAGRRVALDLGSFSITNVDGELDYVVRSYAVDGRKVRVLLGMNTFGYGDFTPIFTGRIVQWSNDTSRVSVQVRDEGYRLDKPMQTDIYTGAGGYNGGADLQGKPRPMSFGKVLNVSPPQIDSANLVYQVHHRAIQAIDAVYDRGAALVADADYASYALLNAASITTGHFATCLALGLIRLGSTPSGLITADVRGDAQSTYIDVTATIAKRIIKDFGGLADADLDVPSWDNFATAQTGTMGWWQGTTAITVSAALDQIIGHCGGWWGAMPSGLIQVGQLAAPTAAAAILDIGEADLIDFEIAAPLAGTFPPRFRQRVGYQKLWTTQADQDVAAGVTAARRLYLQQDVRITSTTDTAVQTDFLLAVDPDPLISLFNSSSDALALSAALMTLYKAFRQTVRLTLGLKGLGAKLSATVLVTHPRLNNGSPTPMLVMDITILADSRQVELVVWG